jgi:hypothetical protein
MNDNSLFDRNCGIVCIGIDENSIFMDVYCIVTIGCIISLFAKIMRKRFDEYMICFKFTKTDQF